MRIKLNKPPSGKQSGGGQAQEITFSGPLYLNGDPVHNRAAATKRYVDSHLTRLDAIVLKEGVLPVKVLPSFAGDVNNPQGTNVFTLTSNGVATGSYAKVQVDIKGRVTGGGPLRNEDIPNLTWPKVIKDKPNTLAGYGITDCLSNAGGEVGEGFTIQGQATDPNHLVNLRFISDLVAGKGSNARPGSVFKYGTNENVAGFLRCNGGHVSKSVYQELYSVIGDKYYYDGLTSFGVPWQNQYNVNRTQPHSLGQWLTGLSAPNQISNSAVAVTRNRVYLIGGNLSSGSKVNTVYIGKLDGEGKVYEWETAPTFPIACHKGRTLVDDNYLYVYSAIDNSLYADKAYRAEINTDGSLGSWSSVNSPGTHISRNAMVLVGDHLYSLGGVSGSSTSSSATSICYRAPVTKGSGIGSFVTHSTNLPVNLADSQAILVRNRIYLVGGFSGSLTNPVRSNKVLTAGINPDGSFTNWTTSVPLDTPGDPSVAEVDGRTLVFPGGASNSNLETVKHSLTVNPELVTEIKLTVPHGGFLTVEAETRREVNGEVTETGVSQLTIPEGVKRVTVTGRGAPGEQYRPAIPASFAYLQYNALAEDGRDSLDTLQVREGLRTAFETFFVAKRLPDLTDGEVDPYPDMASKIAYYTSQMNQHTDIEIHNFFQGPQVEQLREVASVRVNESVRANLHGILTRKEKLSTPNSHGETDILVVYYLGASYYWQEAQAEVPVSIGEDSTFSYKGQTYRFEGTLGTSLPEFRSITVDLVAGQRDLTFHKADHDFSSITYQYYELTGESQEQTYLTSTTINIQDVSDFNIFGKGSNWLRDLPQPTSGHACYTTRHKAYVFGGTETNAVYSAVIDDCRVLGRWENEANLPTLVTDPVLVSTAGRITLFSSRGSISSSATGGFNDYSRYYTGVAAFVVPPGFFVLPDFGHSSKDNTYFYIKY